MSDPIKVYDGLTDAGITALIADVRQALDSAQLPAEGPEAVSVTQIEIPPFQDLFGVDDSVYRQMNSALAAGCRNFMFYGPPGTGKTTLAQRLAAAIADDWRIVTGSSDWTSQDIIGGYHPLPGGALKFQAGVLLEHFDKPLVIDELNRCDIDKVIGPLFTVLSGHSTTLSYLVDPQAADSPRVQVNPFGPSAPPATYAPSAVWRLIATINSIDKASLYQMSYALTRRFAWIYVDVPRDKTAFVRAFVAKSRNLAISDTNVGACPLARVWELVSDERPMGAAPIIDIIKLILARTPEFNFFEPADAASVNAYLDGFFMYLMPMLDGVLREQAERLAGTLSDLLLLAGPQRDLLLQRLLTVAV